MKFNFNISAEHDISCRSPFEYILNNKNLLQYSLGALLYSPAVNDSIADNLISRKYDNVRSLAFCLEDAVADDAVHIAENQLVQSFEKIFNAVSDGFIQREELPFFFIRVRNPEQIERVFNRISQFNLLTGFIFPKFNPSNAFEYINNIMRINKNSDRPIYFMPILESSDILSIETRIDSLKQVRKILLNVKQFVLNVRIGGNDFCNVYGFRRNSSQTIYDIAVLRNVIADIVNVFGMDYVISAPVWEYFENPNDDAWKSGLECELKMDRLNGLIGKTAIHPSQVSIINNSLMVDKDDYFDAVKILNWKDDVFAVSKSVAGDRMNEKKVHTKWAEKIIALSCIYGVK